jgi:hypothetical protein
MLAAILCGLAKGLGVSAKALGIGAYASYRTDLDPAACFEQLKGDAQRLLR